MDIFSYIMQLLGLCYMLLSRTKAASYFLRAHRNSRTERRRLHLEHNYGDKYLFDPETLIQLVPVWFRHQKFYNGRILKIKEQTDNEKGVLLIKFSETFSKLKRDFKVEQILQDYYLVLEPSYSGFCDPEILYFMAYRDHPVVVQAADQPDYDFITRLNSNLIPIRMGSSDWTNDRVFHPLGIEKKYDIIMVALWGDIKRHYLLFDAVRKMHDPTYKICLCGGEWGRVQRDFEDMAELYGIRDQIDFYEKQPSTEVNKLLNQSKVSILLTLKEGANRALFEGFFADVPGVVLENNIGVNKNYFNDQTGVVVPDNKLTEALVALRSGYSSYSPRKWALEHISCEASTRKLEKLLTKIAASKGEKFTGPLAVKVNPEMDYYRESERLSPFEFDKYHR